MKKHSFLIITTILFCMSCAKTEKSNLADFQGSLSLDISFDILINETAYNEIITKADPPNFDVKIFLTKDKVNPVLSFDKITALPSEIVLDEGKYFATVSVGTEVNAAFDSPYYYGKSEDFTIVGGEKTNVSLSCSAANIKVTVAYSDNVKTKFTDYSTTISNETGSLVFNKTENRAGFFDKGNLQVVCSLKYGSDATTKEVELRKTISSPKVGKHYEVKIDINPVEGSSNISLSIIDTYETETVDLTDGDVYIPTEAGTGKLLITEIMADPSILSDSNGEWIEIYNNSTESINLKNMFILSGSSSHKIANDVVIQVGGFAVIGNTENATALVNYVYNLSLTNTGKALGIKDAEGKIVCWLNFGDSGFPKVVGGKSLQLDPTIKNETIARLGSNWCVATATYPVNEKEDYGTPGKVNTSCK